MAKPLAVIKNAIIGSLSFIVAAAIMAVILAIPLYLAWNLEMPKFGLRSLTVIDAILLAFICSLLFRSSSTIHPNLLK